MRALLVGEGWPPDRAGGLNRYFRALHEHLPGADVDVAGSVVVGPAQPAEQLHVVPNRPLPFRVLDAARRVDALAREADVLDVHFALYGALPVSLPVTRRLPLVVHFHGPWAAESRAGGEAALPVRLKRVVEQSVFRSADRFIVLSDSFANELATYEVDETRIVKVRPGVDLDRFQDCSDEQRSHLKVDLGVPNSPLMVSVRRLVPRMGLDILIQSWAATMIARSTAHLVIVGEGPERQALAALATELGVGESVRFTGHVNERRLADWYAAADVALTPSVSLEGFGLVLLEALASGTPVLASDVGGIREAIRGLGGAHLVAPGDVEAWAQAIDEALSGDRALVKRSDARRYAEQHSWAHTADAVKAVYAEAIEQRKHPR